METTQERLLSAAAKLFAYKGYAGVSMRSIAAATGITQAAIYHHFTNKDELYIAVVRHLLEKKTANLMAELAAVDDPAQRLQRLVSDMLQIFHDDPQFRQIYFRELLDGDSKRLADLAETVFADLHDTLEALMNSLSPGMDSHLLMVSLMGMIFHHLEAMKLSIFLPYGRPEHAELPILAKHISSLFLNGLNAK